MTIQYQDPEAMSMEEYEDNSTDLLAYCTWCGRPLGPDHDGECPTTDTEIDALCDDCGRFDGSHDPDVEH